MLDSGEFDRSPPYSNDAETSVLSAMMINASACADAIGFLSADDFFFERHGRLFRSIAEVYERGEKVDVITLLDHLRNTSEIEAVGGIDYVSALIDVVHTTANVDAHAKIIVEKAALRRLIEVSKTSIADAYESGSRSASDILGDAETRLLRIHRGGSTGPKLIKDRLWAAFEDLEERQSADGETRGIETGLADLDSVMLGLHPGQVTVVAARPSMGKTALGQGFAIQAALAGVTTLVFSFEMSAEELILRSLAMEGRLDLQKLLAGRPLTTEEQGRLATAAGHLNPAPLYIDDSQENHIGAVAAKSRRAVHSQGVGAIILDYLQLMEGDGDGRREQIDSITRRVKSLSRRLQVPIVLLSQLSRGPENRTNKRPLLSDLRESGGIEQDADNVVLLYRPEYYMSPEQMAKPDNLRFAGLTELIIAKQRNGPTGTVKVHFRKKSTRFENLVRESGRA